MAQDNTDFGQVADDLRRAAGSFALLTSSATAFGASLNSFREFERQLVLTNAIAGGTVQQYRKMSDAARNFSLVTTTSATEAGAALQQLAQAGFSVQNSLQAMNGVLLLAQATLSDVRVTSDVISSNIRAFGLAAFETTRVANTFTAAITSSLATMDKLAFAFRQVAPVAELAGLSIEETTAALSVLFNVGLRGEQAGTALRNIIIRLVRPLGAASDLLREAGIATRDTTGEFRKLDEILTDIAQSDLNDADLARIFETEALAGVKAFINALQDVNEEGVNQYDALKEAVTGTDRAVQIAAQNLETFDGAMKLFRNTIADVSKDLGAEIAEPIVAITERIRELVGWFRSLDEETQSTIIKVVAYGTAITGALAATNALILLLRGPALAGMAAFAGQSIATGGALSGIVSSTAAVLTGIGNFTIALASGGAALRAYMASVTATSAALGVRGLTGAINTAAASFSALRAAAVAYAPLAAGAAVVAAGVYGISRAMDSAILSAEELNEKLQVDSEDFRIAQADAKEVADAILGQGTQEEVARRVSNINREMEALRYASPLDRAQYTGRREGELLNLKEQADQRMDDLEEGFASVEEYFRREQVVNDAIRKFKEEGGNGPLAEFFSFGKADDISAGMVREQFLGDAYEQMSDRQKAYLAQLRESGGSVLKNQREINEAIKEINTAEQQAIFDMVEEIRRGEADYGENFSAAIRFIEQSDIFNEEGFVQRISEALASQEGAVDVKDVLRSLLEETGASAESITDLLTVAEQNRNAALLKGIQELNKGLQGDLEDIALELKEQQVEKARTMGEAVRLGRELGMAELEADLKELGADLSERFDKLLTDFNIDNREGIQEAVEKSLDEAGIDIDGLAPGFSEVISGEALTDAINERIDGSTTEQEANRIIQEQTKRFQKIMAVYVETIAEVADLTPDQIKELQTAFGNSSDLVEQSALAGLGEAGKTIEEARQRIEKERDKAKREREKAQRERERAARERKQAVEDQIDQARQLEDVFADLASASTKAQQSYYEAVRGVATQTREGILFDLEKDEIVQQYDKQIRDLQRALQDLELEYANNPRKLNEVRQEYGTVIAQVEAARSAELEATNDFEHQMDRRRQALEDFQTDMQQVAYETGNVWNQAGAGLFSGLAEYQKDLTSIMSITKDATVDYIDTVSEGLVDVIYGVEDAWENLDKALLDISKNITKEFMKGFTQQAISSLTGGEGSIFGNALFPSIFKSEGTPGVGGGGLLGRLFPGVFKDQNGTGAPEVEGNAVQDALEQARDKTIVAYQEHLADQKKIFNDFVVGLGGAMQQVVRSVQSIAADPGGQNGAVGTLAGAANTATGGALGTVGAVAGVGAEGVGRAVQGIFGPYIEAGKSAIQEGMASLGSSTQTGAEALKDGIIETASALQVSPRDLATVISYETGGTFDPRQAGPTTQHGQHRGLIQFGEPQAAQFGADFSSELAALNSQLGENGAIVKYLKSSGFQPGMGIEDLYSTINAGAPGLYDRSDANNGGAPGTVLDKINDQFPAHYAKVDRVFGDFEQQVGGMSSALTQAQQQISGILPDFANGTPPFVPMQGGAGQGQLAGGTGADILGGIAGQGQGALQQAQQFQQTMMQFNTQMQQTVNQFGTQFAQSLNQAVQSVVQAAGGTGGGNISFSGIGGGNSGSGGFNAGQAVQLLNMIPGFAMGGLMAVMPGMLASGAFKRAAQGGGGINFGSVLQNYLFDSGSGRLGSGAGGAGKIPGSPSTADDLLARLSEGEYIVNAKSTRKHLGLLEMINGDKLPGFATGGRVGGGGGNTYHSRGGDTISLRVNYVNSGGDNGRGMNRSPTQQAKQLLKAIERAKKNV